MVSWSGVQKSSVNVASTNEEGGGVIEWWCMRLCGCVCFLVLLVFCVCVCWCVC